MKQPAITILLCFWLAASVSQAAKASPTADELAQGEFEAGVQFMSDEKFLSAADSFQRATDSAPKFYEAWVNWGTALVHLGLQARTTEIKLMRFQEATAKFERATILRPDEKRAFKPWIDTLIHAGDLPLDAETRLACYSGAVEKCRKVLELDPRDWSVANQYGLILIDKLADFSRDRAAQAQLFEQAEKLFAQASENTRFSSERGPVCANRARALVEMGKLATEKDRQVGLLEKANAEYEASAEAMAREPSTYLLWGDALIELGKAKESRTSYRLAVEKFQHALELAPDQPAVLYELARAYCLNNDLLMAVQTLERCFKLEGSEEFLKRAPDEPDLRALRPNPEFERVLRDARARQ